MSRIRANTIVNGAGTGAPNFPRGAIISGISTINADLNASNVSFSGITTTNQLSLGTGTSISSPATNELALGTNNTEKLRINSDGDLGLGTTSPNHYNNYQTLTINGTNGGEIDLEVGGTLTADIFANSGGLRLNTRTADPIIFSTNNGSSFGERLRIASDGIVTKPNHPCFMVRNSVSGSAFAADSKATWNLITTNNGSHFDDANDRFVCPVTAIYFFSCQMLSMSATRLFHELRLNGVRVDGTRTESYQASDYQTNTFTAVVSASANDYFEVWLGGNAGYGNIYANFNGYLIG